MPGARETEAIPLEDMRSEFRDFVKYLTQRLAVPASVTMAEMTGRAMVAFDIRDLEGMNYDDIRTKYMKILAILENCAMPCPMLGVSPRKLERCTRTVKHFYAHLQSFMLIRQASDPLYNGMNPMKDFDMHAMTDFDSLIDDEHVSAELQDKSKKIDDTMRKTEMIRYMLRNMQRDGCGLIGDHVAFPIYTRFGGREYNTGAWKRRYKVDEYIKQCCSREIHTKMFEYSLNNGVFTSVLEYLCRGTDPLFPKVNMMGTVVAFQNGQLFLADSPEDMAMRQKIVDMERAYVDRFTSMPEYEGFSKVDVVNMAKVKARSDFLTMQGRPGEVSFPFNGVVFKQWDDPTRPGGFSACKFMDMPFSIELLGYSDYMDIPTPEFDRIFLYQLEQNKYVRPKLPAELADMPPDVRRRETMKLFSAERYQILRHIYPFIGRMLFELEKFDAYQIAMYFLGAGGTGKSTIIDNVLRLFFDESDIGELQSENDIFTLGNIYPCRACFCPELGRRPGIPQETIQKMISGEHVGLREMNKGWTTVKWVAPMVFASNHFPFNNDEGQVSRRFLLLLFQRVIPKHARDSSLKYKLREEIMAILYKCARAYREFTTMYNNFDVFGQYPVQDPEDGIAFRTVMPTFFHLQKAVGECRTNPTAEFLAESDLLHMDAARADIATQWKRLLAENSGLHTAIRVVVGRPPSGAAVSSSTLFVPCAMPLKRLETMIKDYVSDKMSASQSKSFRVVKSALLTALTENDLFVFSAPPGFVYEGEVITGQCVANVTERRLILQAMAAAQGGDDDDDDSHI